MATRQEREKLQRANERYKNVLAVLLSREENKYCADCLAKGPRWASWNLGVLVCIRCSGLHRSLGVHISRVKSVNLDTWTKDQMVNFCSRGNGWAKDMYEAKLPKDFRRPQSDSSLECFIRDKYERKKYISPVEIKLRSVADLGLLEDNTDASQKGRKKEQRNRENVSIVSIAKPKGLQPMSPGIPRPKSLPQLPKHEEAAPIPVQKHTPGAAADDLLGLSSPISSHAPVAVKVAEAPAPPSADLTEDLFGPMSSYNGQPLTMTASISSPDLLNGAASSTSPEPTPIEQSVQDKKMSKDSILSLYSQGTKSSSPNSMISTGYNIPSQSNVPYQQSAMPYGQQSFSNMQNMSMQGMPGAFSNQQQQMLAMQQQQQQFQMQQMAQQMTNMNVSGGPGGMGYPMMAGQGQQTPMQNSMGYGMGFAAQPQASQPFSQQQQMYGGMANGTQGVAQMPGVMPMGTGYSAMPNAMMNAGVPPGMTPGLMVSMQGQPGTNGMPWGANAVPPTAAGMNSGHTLSTQLWK